MEIINSLVLFAIGFFILIKGAQILVRGAVSIANIFQISTWFIGTVIVSIGTSIPELSINLASAFSGNDIGIATVIGSNIFNVLMVLGFMAIFYPIVMKKAWVFKDLIVFIVITIMASVVILFPVLGSPSLYGVSMEEGLLLLSIFLVWLVYMLSRWDGRDEDADIEVVTLFSAFILILGGIVGVFVGGRWVVDGASTIAELAGVSPAVIGFTLVAFGTSLPEFVVSAVAMFRGAFGIAVGNIVGSSIFNFLVVLGITSLVQPIVVFEDLTFDVMLVIATSVLFFLLMFVGKKYTLARFEGFILVLLYIGYLVHLFIR